MPRLSAGCRVSATGRTTEDLLSERTLVIVVFTAVLVSLVTALRSVPAALATVTEVETHLPMATARAGSSTFTAWSCFHINGIGLIVVIAAAAAVAAVAPAPAVAAVAPAAAATVAPAAVAAVAPAAVAAAIVSAASALVFALALFLTDVVALVGAYGTERAVLKSDDAGGSGQNKAGGTS